MKFPYSFPALRGQLKTTEYFLVSMPFGVVDRLAELPEGRIGRTMLDGLEMQRELNWTRVKRNMTPYLVHEPDAFYSAVTTFIVPLDLSEADQGVHYEFKSEGDSDIGRLSFGGSVVLFPGDGQHRIASIQEAIQQMPQMVDATLPVVLIPFKGKEQVRQLFADLNRNAKPVGASIAQAFETRDPLVILSKRVATDVDLFRGRVNERSTSLPASYPQVITMSALVESNKQLIAALAGIEATDTRVKEYLDHLKRLVPTDSEVGDAAEPLIEVWEAILQALPAWRDVLNGPQTPGEIREEFVFAHGLGWQAIAHAVAVVIRAYKDKDEGWLDIITDMLEAVDWRRQTKSDPGNPDWQGIAALGLRVNNTRESVRATAGYILSKGGISPTDDGAGSYLTTYESLRQSYNQARVETERLSPLAKGLAGVDLDPGNAPRA